MFILKTQTILGRDRGTQLSILQNPKNSQYACNSEPIDNTDVSRSLAEFDREFQLSLYIELSAIPELNDESNSTLYNCLLNVSSDASFSTSVLQVLIKEQWEAHRQRWDKG